MQREVASAELAARRVEVEVETIDGIDLGEPGVPNAAIDGALDTARFLRVGKGTNDGERGQGLSLGMVENRGELQRHTRQAEPPKLVGGELEQVVILHDHSRR